MCQPYSKLKLRCAFKADWPDWDIDEDSFSRWADLDIDCPLLVTMMKEHETDLIERGDFDPDEWGTDETTLFDGVHLHIDGGHIGLFGGFCGRDSGIGPAQRAKTPIWN